jgi:hypothetical protein
VQLLQCGDEAYHVSERREGTHLRTGEDEDEACELRERREVAHLGDAPSAGAEVLNVSSKALFYHSLILRIFF